MINKLSTFLFVLGLLCILPFLLTVVITILSILSFHLLDDLLAGLTRIIVPSLNIVFGLALWGFIFLIVSEIMGGQ